MSLTDKITEDMKKAMKEGDHHRRDVLRMLKSKLRNREIDLGEQMSEEEEIKVLNSAVKKLKESMALYEQGGRKDLYDKEASELDIIQSYLPKQLSDEELEQVVEQVITEQDATSGKDFGRVMKEIMSRYQGQVDGNKVQTLVREKLL